jgi:hypothetical protein
MGNAQELRKVRVLLGFRLSRAANAVSEGNAVQPATPHNNKFCSTKNKANRKTYMFWPPMI